MNRIMSSLMASALSLSFVGAGMAPVNAASIYVPLSQAASGSSDVQNVDWRPNRNQVLKRSWRGNRNWRGGRSGWRAVQNNRGGYWNGHRGYRNYHRGYRRHGDYWFPLAAFATGALITGAIANDRPAYSGGSHEAYCYNRYRSYRAYDNTFQPYNGPRQQCR